MSALLPSTPLSVAATAGFVTATLAVLALSIGQSEGQSRARTRKTQTTTTALQSKLPKDLYGWREHSREDRRQDTHWNALREMFAGQGYVLWEQHWDLLFGKPGDRDVAQNGFAYGTPVRRMNENAGGLVKLYSFLLHNHSCHAATAADGRFVVIRVVKVGNEGQRHLDILRFVARGPISLYSNNHALPLLQEIQYEDITFGVFPYVGNQVLEIYHDWAENSVGDLVDMIMQMLSALAFIHGYRIAHRDAFKDNFLVQWQPETMKAGAMSVLRPRVYLHDFESAVQFPKDCPVEEQVLVGLPVGSWTTDYGRSSPPEVLSGAPYNPYKVDVWQLGTSLSDMKTTILDIDKILVALVEPDAAQRMTAVHLLQRFKDVVYAMPPNALIIPPVIIDPGSDLSQEKDATLGRPE